MHLKRSLFSYAPVSTYEVLSMYPYFNFSITVGIATYQISMSKFRFSIELMVKMNYTLGFV